MTTSEDKIKSAVEIARVILPDTASPVEVALLSVELASLAEIDVSIISTIWDPYAIPAPLIPWLAWALSVDVWDDSWSEQRKRDVIAASPIVHRRKGTLDAVERSVAPLGVEVDVLEWHLQNPVGRRGTFSVESRYNDDDLEDLRVATEYIEQSVNRTKPKSRVVDFKHIIRRKTNHRVGVIQRFCGKIAVTNVATENQSNTEVQSVGIATRTSGSIVVRNEA